MTGVTKAVVCYPVCGIMHIKETFLLIGKSIPCSGGSRFLLSLSEWSLTICLMPYNHKSVVNVFRVCHKMFLIDLTFEMFHQYKLLVYHVSFKLRSY